MSEPKTRIVRQLRNGQITIPKEFRDAMHLEPDDLLSVTLEEGRLSMTPARATDKQGSPWLKELYDLFEPVRASIAAQGFTEQEVNDAIDDSIREVRAEAKQRRRSA